MPYHPQSQYKRRPFYLINRHWETILPSVLLAGPEVRYERIRLELPDDDFLDVDYLKTDGHRKALVITHGLEGDSLIITHFQINELMIARWCCTIQSVLEATIRALG